MLLSLDNLLRDHLLAELPALGGNLQRVRFQPPDDDLLTAVRNLNATAINLYLVEVKENRELRSNARTDVVRNGDVFSTRSPDWLECNYIVSAWSPAQPSPAVEPTLDEHQLLYEAAHAFFRHVPLSPTGVYPPGAPELALWGRFQDEHLPMSVAPPEGYPGIGDFWSSMGQDARWRPSLFLTVSIPVELTEDLSGPMVLTRFASYRVTDSEGAGDTLLQIGGHVIDNGAAGGPAPLVGVFVSLEDLGSNQVLAVQRTDQDGRFTFERLRAANYRLSTRAVGLPVNTRDIAVPEPSGHYDLTYP